MQTLYYAEYIFNECLATHQEYVDIFWTEFVITMVLNVLEKVQVL